MSEFDIDKNDVRTYLSRWKEFTSPEDPMALFFINSKPRLENIEYLTQFGIANDFSYKFECDQAFPIDSLLKVKCTTTDGKTLIVSGNVCSDIRHCDEFVLDQAIPEFKDLGNRDIEILFKIKSDREYIVSDMYRYQVEMLAILDIEPITLTRELVAKLNQKIIFEGVVDNIDFKSRVRSFWIDDVKVECDSSTPNFDSGEEYYSFLQPLEGDKIQIKGLVTDISDDYPVVSIPWCNSITLIKAGEQRKKIDLELKNKYKKLLQKACNPRLPEQEIKLNFVELITQMYDHGQHRLMLSGTQFNALHKILKNKYKDLESLPIILTIFDEYLKNNFNLEYLMAFGSGVGYDILFCDKTEFKKRFLEFYSDDKNFAKIEQNTYPIYLLNKIFSQQEIGEILEKIIITLRNKYNSTEANLDFKQSYVFDALIKKMAVFGDLETAKKVFNQLLEDILNNNYRKYYPSNLEGFSPTPDNFFEYEISSGLESFFDRAIKNNRQDLIEEMIKGGGTLEKVIEKLKSSDAYNFPRAEGGYFTYFEDLLELVRNYLEKIENEKRED